MRLATLPERLPWSNDEVHWVVADHLAMLTLALTGQPYNKTARRNALLPKLNGRTASSIEHQPRSNFEKASVEAMTSQVQRLPLLDQAAEAAEAAEAAVPRPAARYEESDFNGVETIPPKHDHQLRVEEEVRHHLAGPIRRDYLDREARNRGHANRFKLYRFCKFRARPRMFQFAGPIEQHCRLDPSTFRVQFQ